PCCRDVWRSWPGWLRDWSVCASCQLPDRGDEVGEPIALNNDVAAQQRLRLGGIAVQDRPDDRLVFGERRSEPARNSKLQAPVWLQAPAQGAALLQKKVIVAAKINGVVEELVAIVVAVRVGRSDRASAGFVRLEQAVAIPVVRAAGGKSSGPSFKLGHHLEHLDDFLRRVRCDDR